MERKDSFSGIVEVMEDTRNNADMLLYREVIAEVVEAGLEATSQISGIDPIATAIRAAKMAIARNFLLQLRNSEKPIVL